MKRFLLIVQICMLNVFLALGQAKIYRCTPCGNPACDRLVFNHPGFCPVCKMPLIEQNAPQMLSGQQVAAQFDGHWEGTAGTTDQQLRFSLDIVSNPLHVRFNSPDLKAMKVTARNVSFSSDSVYFELAGDRNTTCFHGTLNNGKLVGRLITNDQSVSAENRVAWFQLRLASLKLANYTVTEVNWRNGSTTLSGSLYMPKGTGRFPAIVCNHSSGDQQRYDGAFMADYLATRGIAVLIYDKRGDGQSTGDWKTSTFEDLADDCIEGIKYLQTIKRINPHLIGIFGHSQGGTISPIIINRYPYIAFNIAAAAFAVSPEEQDIFRVTNILKLDAHFDNKMIDSAISFYKIWLQVGKTGKGWSLFDSANLKVKNQAWYPWVQPPAADNWVWKWYRIAGNYNYNTYWEKVKVPTLLIYGANDEVTPVEPSVKAIVRDLKKAGNRKYTVIIIPNSLHYFTKINKAGDLWTLNTPLYMKSVYNWISKTCALNGKAKKW